MSKTKDVMVKVRMNKAEKKRLKEFAELSGASLSYIVRISTTEYMEQNEAKSV